MTQTLHDFIAILIRWCALCCNSDKNFKQKLDPNLGIYVCKAEKRW